jgi:hypothetical protein
VEPVTEAAAGLGGPVTETTVGLVEPVTETAACLGGPVTETTVGLVEPVTAAAAGLGVHVTETTVGLAVNKDKMLEAYETGDKAGKLSMVKKGTLTGCRI